VQAIVLLVALAVFVAAPLGTLGNTPQLNAPAYQPGNGISNPVLIKEVKPVYTHDAKERRLEGTVELDAVVLPDGSVDAKSLKVTRSLDVTYGLDEEAKKAVGQWKFRPAVCKRQDGCAQYQRGQPVPALVSVELTFTLHHGPVYKVADAGVTAPSLLKHVSPDYDDAARQERIQGTVLLAGIVETDGTVSGIRVVKSLDERLDRQAIKALGQWKFNPGQRDGVAVRVETQIEMTFSVK
jgi:TonB family protein